MRSIHRQVTLGMGAAAALLLLLLGAALYLTLRGTLTAEFDESLVLKAQALAKSIDADDDDDPPELDTELLEALGFGAANREEYFALRQGRDRVLARSPGLPVAALPPPPGLDAREEIHAGVLLPDGRPGRAVWLKLAPRDEDGRPLPELILAVAGESTGLNRTIAAMGAVLGGFALLGLGVIAVVPRMVLSAGLKPLDHMGAEVQKIDLHGTERRLTTERLPAELRPVAEKINALLARLEEAFARERRFSSHAAHELRTPLAELRVMTEVGVRWPEEFTAGQGQEMLKAIGELDALLEKLSVLARADARAAVNREPVDLPASVAECLRVYEERAVSRALTWRTRVSPGAISTDPVLWRAILSNLVSNAVSHAPAGSEIRLVADERVLEVANPAPDLREEHLPQLFQRFWRRDRRSKEGEAHSGLGLSIVTTCAELLGGSCEARLEGGDLVIRVRWAALSE